MKNFAIVENGKVINVIVADDDFAQMYSKSPDHIGECFEYDEMNEDDTRVARIGEIYINGLFVSETQAMDMGLIPDTRIVPVPESITMRQCRLALLDMKLLPLVDQAINSLPSPQKEQAQIEWEYASEVRRDNPLIGQLMQALGMDETELDNLFIEGAAR